MNVQDLRVPVAPVEYVILQKLSYFAQTGSTRHLEDIARVRRVQGRSIDVGTLEQWIGVLGLHDPWTRALATDIDRI